MKVKLKVKIDGTPAGQELEVSKEYGEKLIACRYAVRVKAEKPAPKKAKEAKEDSDG
jgi:hypothetical protein